MSKIDQRIPQLLYIREVIGFKDIVRYKIWSEALTSFWTRRNALPSLLVVMKQFFFVFPTIARDILKI